MLALLVVTFAVPTAAEVVALNQFGFTTQGRYLLPTFVGVLMLAAHALSGTVLDDRYTARLLRLATVVTVPIQLVFLDLAMVYWQIGFPRDPGRTAVNALRGTWHPPAGSATALVAGATGGVVLLVFAWIVTARATATPLIPRQRIGSL